MRGEGGVAGEGSVVGAPKFHSWGKCTMPLNEHQLRLDVQRFLWPVYINLYYAGPLSCTLGCNIYPIETSIHANICPYCKDWLSFGIN